MPRKTGTARPPADPPDETKPEEGGPVGDQEPEDDGPAPGAFEDEETAGLDETEEEDHFFAIWYGQPGSTKTTSIAKILKARPQGKLLICNAEAGLKVKALRQHGIDTSRIEVWPRPGVRPTFDALERLVMKVDAQMGAARRAGEPNPYCAFGLDSVTELVKLMLDNLQEDGLASQRELDRKARAQGVTPPRRNQRKRFQAERDDYQVVSGQMRNILRRLRYMDLDFLVTALVRRDEDQDTGKTMYGPASPPALQQDLLGYADIVIRVERRESEDGKSEEIVGYTLADENNHGKDRYGLLPAEVIEPGADTVLGYITGDAQTEAPAQEPTPDSESEDEEAEGQDEAAGTESGEYKISEETETKLQAIEAEQAAKPKTTARARRSRAKTPAASTRGATVASKVGPSSGSDDNPPF